jgi:hypothetical protein
MQWESISRQHVAASGPPPFSGAPPVGYCPSNVRAPLAEILAKHTSTPEVCWVCAWEGFSGLAEAFPGAVRVLLPHRTYILLLGSLEAVTDGFLLGKGMRYVSPSIWWPQDRAWCVTTEVDFCWTYVAGTQMCIEDVVTDARLEALITETGHRADYLSDDINGPVRPY